MNGNMLRKKIFMAIETVPPKVNRTTKSVCAMTWPFVVANPIDAQMHHKATGARVEPLVAKGERNRSGLLNTGLLPYGPGNRIPDITQLQTAPSSSLVLLNARLPYRRSV